jgi:uncharacterized protein involved in exopolysaccharide biosynthesis
MQNKNESSELTISHLLKIYRNNLRFIVLFVGISLTLIAVYSFIIPESFRSSASIQPPDDGSSSKLSGLLMNFTNPLAMSGQTNKILLFLEYLKSREAMVYIADSLNFSSRPQFSDLKKVVFYKLLGDMFDISVNRNGILRINVSVETPYFPSSSQREETAQLASDLANSAILALDFMNKEKSISKARKKRILIEQMLIEKKHELDSIDAELENFQTENKIVGLDKQASSVLGNAVGVGSELAKAEIELKSKQLEFDESSPIIKAYQSRVQNLRQQYERIQSGGLTSSDKYSIPINKIPGLLRKYTNLMRDQKVKEIVVSYLESQRYQEAVQEQGDIPSVEAIDHAVPAYERSSPNRSLMMILGFIISSVFALAIVTVKAFWQGQLIYNMEKEAEE